MRRHKQWIDRAGWAPVAMSALLAAACGSTADPPAPEGPIRPAGSQQALDSAVASLYDQWKASYVAGDCGGNYVSAPGGVGSSEPTVTTSESHGYGMVITALMAGHDPQAQGIFDGFYKVFRAFPSTFHANLMAWAVGSGCVAISGPDSATDGDLDIAYALLLADKEWGSSGTINYLNEAKKVITDIKAGDFNVDFAPSRCRQAQQST